MSNNIIRRTWKQGGLVNIEDLRGSAFQAEDGGHTFLISGLDENGDALALSGTPAGVLLRADGQDVTLTCSVSEGVVSATLPANAYVVPGRVGITIFLTNGGQKTAIYAAVGSVATTSSGIVAPPAGSDVVDLVNAIATAVATIPASYTDLMAAVAPTYSTSALYAVGSYAWYSGKLYRCTTAITSGETWTSAHWTQANLGSDVSDLKSAINKLALSGEYSIFSGIEWTSGYYLQNDGTTATHDRFFLSDYIDIAGFSKIQLKNKSSNVLIIAQYNSSKVYIASTYINVSANSTQVATIDSNAKYILVSVGNWSTMYSLDVLLSNVEVNGNNAVSDTNALANQNKTDIDSIKKYLTNILNVVNLGVDNTGETDVTSSLISIITNAPDGSVIYLPKGTYLTSYTINIKNRNNITILGDGNISGTIIRYTGAYGAFNIVGGDTVAIMNLAIYGINNPRRAITYSDETTTSLESRAFNMVVEDVRIAGFETGIALWSPTGYVYFKGVIITNLLENGTGFDLGGGFQNTAEIIPNYAYLEHCIVENVSGSGLYGVRVTCGQAVFIHDCDICNFTEGTAIYVSNTNSYNRKCEDIYILNNSIYNNFRGIALKNLVDDYFIRNINISNNMIRIHGDGYGISFSLEENALKFQNVTVVGNVFSGFYGNTPTNLTGLSNVVTAARFLAGVGIET